MYFSFYLGELVHAELVEKLIIDDLNLVEVKKLKNLKQLYTGASSKIDSTLLSSLEQLKEVHLITKSKVRKLFDQKQRYGCDSLKIYLCGLLLNGPDDPATSSSEAFLRCSAENPSRLADEIPFFAHLNYSTIESAVPKSKINNLLKRYADLVGIRATQPVQDIQRFLDLLRNFKNVVKLRFECAQPQDLFDRLPEHSAVQELIIGAAPSDHQFLFRLQHLLFLNLNYPLNVEFIRKVLEELPLLASFKSQYNNKDVQIRSGLPKKFQVVLDGNSTNVPDLNSAIQFLVDSAPIVE